MVKKFLLVQVLRSIKAGKSPAKICKELDVSKQKLNYYVAKLKKQGCIEKVSYGTWRYIKEVKEVKTLTIGQYKDNTNKEIRGHAFIWKIEFAKAFNWADIVRHYKGKKLTFQKMFNGKVHRTLFMNRKIWLTSKGIIIYEPIDFLGHSSFEVKGMAIYDMDLLIKSLLRVLNIKFKPYRFTTSREHYGMIKNELARQYNAKKEKMLIRSEEGTTWLWIDDSKGLGELETNKPKVSRQVQNFWNDHKKHNFEFTPTFTLNLMNGIQQNQLIFDKNMSSHLEVIKELGKGVKELRREVAKFHRK